jgi:hypothetical protein
MRFLDSAHERRTVPDPTHIDSGGDRQTRMTRVNQIKHAHFANFPMITLRSLSKEVLIRRKLLRVGERDAPEALQ